MLVAVLLAALIGAALLFAAGMKVADPTSMAVAAGTFGVHGRAARWVWLPLAALELVLAVALLAGWGPGTWAATAVLAAFAVAQAAAIAAGRGGAPCGCFGARGRVSWGSVARTALLACAAALLAFEPVSAAPALRAVVALAAVLVAAVVVARVHAAGAPDGALDISGEGPPLGTRIELGDAHGDGVRLALFTSAGCRMCRSLLAPARELGAAVYDEREDARSWAAADVPGAPYAVALGAGGIVLAKGTVNTRRQLASVLAAARERSGERIARETEPASSRRSFLATASAAVGALVAARTIGSFIRPGDADAFHFCGHIFTTDGCPHPTGLPRIDNDGYPLRARDGHPVDDLGRAVDGRGAPVDKQGAPLLDPDGRPLPPTKRTRVCWAAGKRFDLTTQTDGTWSRCCDGHVRKIVDCCANTSRRINGDGALKGYCYGRRKVFCVLYLQSRVPC